MFSAVLSAQISVGTWRTHTSYSVGQSVAYTGTKVYSVAGGSLFSYSISEKSTALYNATNGLHDVNVKFIAYNTQYKVLVVVYENSNIDLITEGGVTNVSDISRKTLSGSKSINRASFDGKNCLLSTDFGLIILDLVRAEIKEIYPMASIGSSAVNDAAADKDNYYAATNKGLYKGSKNSANLIDFSAWQKVSVIAGQEDYYYSDVEMWQNRLTVAFAPKKGDIINVCTLMDGVWRSLYPDIVTPVEKNIMQLKTTGDNIMLLFNGYIRTVKYNTTSAKFQHVNYLGKYVFSDPLISTRVGSVDAEFVNANEYFIADNSLGLVNHKTSNVSTVLAPNGPYSNNVFDFDFSTAGLRVVQGGVNGDWNNMSLPAAVSRYSNGVWSSITKSNSNKLNGVYDMISIATDPLDNKHYFVASWNSGLIEFKSDTVFRIYDASNSPLESAIPGSTFFRINGLVFDKDNNLWLTDTYANNPIQMLDKNGQWHTYAFTEIGSAAGVFALGKIIIDQNNLKWVQVPREKGIFVFDDRALTDTAYRTHRKMLQILDEDGKVISNDVYDLAEDKNGAIWVGTANGVVVYYSPERVFNAGVFTGSRIKIPRNDGSGLADLLLDGTLVTSIKVDGGNRKWIGTSGAGLFLVSADGLTTLQHFDTQNSPLPSDNIIRLGIDETNGEVFIATDRGLVSYRSDATTGNEDFLNVHAFPNPVREDFTGNVTITGLVYDTNVKITDVSGNLVFQTTSNGAYATWNGRNFYGKPVGTGIYLVYCASKDGSKSAMTKILVVKKN